jgi:hypothetical protein
MEPPTHDSTQLDASDSAVVVIDGGGGGSTTILAKNLSIQNQISRPSHKNSEHRTGIQLSRQFTLRRNQPHNRHI